MSSYYTLPPDPTLTLHNVTRVVATVKTDCMRLCLGVPYSKEQEMQRTSSTDDQLREGYMNYWLQCGRNSSWRLLAGQFYHCGETRPLERVMEYVQQQKGKYMNIDISLVNW